jgi:citrate synthase
MDSGLAGLVAAETVLSHSDGARGILWVRGHTLADLAANFGYDGAVGLLWEGFAGDGLSRNIMRAQLAEGRVKAFARLGDWLDRAADRPPVEGVRLALASLPADSGPQTSSRPCRSPSRHCCAAAKAPRRSRPTRHETPPTICCA